MGLFVDFYNVYDEDVPLSFLSIVDWSELGILVFFGTLLLLLAALRIAALVAVFWRDETWLD